MRDHLTSAVESECTLAPAIESESTLAAAIERQRTLAAAVECERTLAAGVQRVVVCVHEGQRLITVGTLLRIALVHGVDHHRHFLPGAVQRLLALLGQFPSEWGKRRYENTHQTKKRKQQ